MLKLGKLGIVMGLAATYAMMKALDIIEASVKISKSRSNDAGVKFTYSDAIISVYEHAEFTSTRNSLINIIKPGGTSEYYESIINALAHAEFSSEMVNAVEKITEKFYKS